MSELNQYHKKPVTIEARQLTEHNLEEIEVWCGGAIKGTKLPRCDRFIHIQTLEGEMTALIGDYVIKGVKGEFYPCKPDIFAMTYEPANRRAAPDVNQQMLEALKNLLMATTLHVFGDECLAERNAAIAAIAAATEGEK